MNLDLKDYLFDILLTFVVTYGSIWLLTKSINLLFKRISFINEKKVLTIESVLRTSLNFIGFIILVVIVLEPFVDLTKLLAGAGVLGIVLGFGAQSLIKDILTGFFFLFENQFQKGDMVTINQKYTGTVEEVGFRALKIRDWGGKLLTISNGNIIEILNGNVQKRRVVESVVTSYYEDPEKVLEVLRSVCIELNEEFREHLILDPDGNPSEVFQVRGISNLNSMYHGYEYTVIGLVKDSEYFNIMYKVREEIANGLYRNNIRMAETIVSLETNVTR